MTQKLFQKCLVVLEYCVVFHFFKKCLGCIVSDLLHTGAVDTVLLKTASVGHVWVFELISVHIPAAHGAALYNKPLSACCLTSNRIFTYFVLLLSLLISTLLANQRGCVTAAAALKEFRIQTYATRARVSVPACWATRACSVRSVRRSTSPTAPAAVCPAPATLSGP